MITIGERVKNLRKQNNMDITTLARKMRLTTDKVVDLENNVLKVDDKTILDLACAFSLSSIEYNTLKRLKEGNNE